MKVSKLFFALALATVIPQLVAAHIKAVEVIEHQTMDRGAYLLGSGDDVPVQDTNLIGFVMACDNSTNSTGTIS